MRILWNPVVALAALLCAGAGAAIHFARDAGALGEAPPKISTKVVRWDEARTDRARWGEIRFFFNGEGFTAKDLLAAAAVVKPGEALHAAHRHAEEEFLFIAEGSGAWNVEGKEIPLKKGDVLYVEPWAVHGCTNTGKEPLTFFVARWFGKGVPKPPEPPERTKE